MHFKSKLISVFLTLFVAQTVSASGAGGVGVNRGFDSIEIDRTDPYYEHGKAIYRGKVKEYKGIKYLWLEIVYNH